MRSKRRRELACPERGGGCECSEQTEGLHRGCSYLRQPLSQSALRRIASSPAGEPFGCDTICQDIRVNAQVGTRSPYSLPFIILPVPARSPFRFIRHWRRSTPNPVRGAFWCALQLKHSHGGPPMTAPTPHPINFSAKTRGRSASPHFYNLLCLSDVRRISPRA